jgi:hypothetical protein
MYDGVERMTHGGPGTIFMVGLGAAAIVRRLSRQEYRSRGAKPFV